MLLLCCILLCPAYAADDDASVRALLKKMKDSEPAVMKKLESFGYVEHVVEEDGGKVKTRETFEVTYYKDRRIRRLIEKDGKPLTGSDLEKENRKVEKLVKQLDKNTAPSLDNRRLRLDDLMKATSFSNVKRNKLAGREVVETEFHPQPGYKPANISERFVSNLDGKLWLDEGFLQIARAEFTLRDNFKIAGGLFFTMKAGTRFVDEEIIYQNEVWLPKSREFVMNAKAMIGVKLAIRNSVTYSSYHRFDVSAKDSALSK